MSIKSDRWAPNVIGFTRAVNYSGKLLLPTREIISVVFLSKLSTCFIGEDKLYPWRFDVDYANEHGEKIFRITIRGGIFLGDLQFGGKEKLFNWKSLRAVRPNHWPRRVSRFGNAIREIGNGENCAVILALLTIQRAQVQKDLEFFDANVPKFAYSRLESRYFRDSGSSNQWKIL